jgi:hypothetical protein
MDGLLSVRLPYFKGSMSMKLFLVCLLALLCTLSAFGADNCPACGDDCGCGTVCDCEHPPRAPAGVMGDHAHHQGGWMVSYRYMAMHMEGVGGGNVSGYMMRPESMDMQMHMVGAMYAPLKNLTLAIMVPYIIKDMDGERTMMGTTRPMSVHTEGYGDLRFAGIYDLWSTHAQQVLLNLAVGLPTGSIDEENSAGNRLGYPMQLGSGSYSLIPGITYTGLSSGWGWGAQAKASVPLNENKHDYRLGNRYDLQVWGLHDLCRASAISLRLNGWHRENIHGEDSTLNQAMSPGNDPDLRAATRLDLLAGIDYRASGKLEGLRLTIEGGVPIYQDLDGPQLEMDWMVIGGLQFSF